MIDYKQINNLTRFLHFAYFRTPKVLSNQAFIN